MPDLPNDAEMYTRPKHSQNKVSVYAQKKEQVSLAPFFLSFTILPFSGYHGVNVHI